MPRLYTDDRFRERVVCAESTDPETLRFWREEFPSYTKAFRSEAVAPILNKAGQIAASPQLRLILGQVAPRLDLSFTMNNRRILIANLAKGAIGEQASNFLGSLLVSHLQLVAMERGALAPHERVPFFVHVDEFQTFSSDAFASLLSEASKFATHFCAGESIHRSTTARRPLRSDRQRRHRWSSSASAAATPNCSRRNFVRWTQARLPTRSLSPRGFAAASAATASSRSRKLYEPLGTAEADPGAEPSAV